MQVRQKTTRIKVRAFMELFFRLGRTSVDRRALDEGISDSFTDTFVLLDVVVKLPMGASLRRGGHHKVLLTLRISDAVFPTGNSPSELTHGKLRFRKRKRARRKQRSS